MSFRENKNSELISENMEQEDKIKIEEASVNFDYVKNELDEEEKFEENQYKIALNLENIFGESSIEHKNNRDSIIGSLDGDTMETGSFKLEDVKEENKDLIRKEIKQFHCNNCGGNYQGYCLNCSSLSHILNNLTPNLNPEMVLKSTPINILEIREVSSRYAVVTLKTLPKGIILGPFEGIAPIKSVTGVQWKIKNEKLVNEQNGNWMKYIVSVTNHATKNLDIFQFDGILYFETSREIQEGEELVVCYGVEEVLKLDKEEEFYLFPVKKEYPQVFVCTLCCLGFRLERCLVEHKSKCPLGDHGGRIEDFEIIQCRCCKVWLEKQEHQKSHMMHCLENSNRLRRNMPDFQRKPADEIDETCGNDEISTPIDENSYLPETEVIHFKYSDEVGNANKKEHFNKKKYKCTECSYQSSRKDSLDKHLNTHDNIKPFKCDLCKTKYTQKYNLKVHMQNRHSNTTDKKYKCTKCSYKTYYKGHLNRHLDTHNDIKPFQCDICKKGFSQKGSLKLHVIAIHSNTNEREYKCSECSYQTNRKNNLNLHLNTHNNIKPYQCDTCPKRYSHKSSLKSHTKYMHSNTSENEYKCYESCYQINRENILKTHLVAHIDIKAFECDICKKRFTQKSYMNRHIRYQHSNTSDKKYKCSKCSYQTNVNSNFRKHINTHNGIKPFECDICKMRFSQKGNLNKHIRIQHSTDEKNTNALSDAQN